MAKYFDFTIVCFIEWFLSDKAVILAAFPGSSTGHYGRGS